MRLKHLKNKEAKTKEFESLFIIINHYHPEVVEGFRRDSAVIQGGQSHVRWSARRVLTTPSYLHTLANVLLTALVPG